VFDKTEAIGLFCITEQEYNEMLCEYVAQTCQAMAAMENAIANNDFEAAETVVHSVKGISGNLRVGPAFESAKLLENEIKSRAFDAAQARLAELKLFIDGLAEELKGIVV